MLTTEVAVTSGDAFTVAGVGRHADLGLRVLNDDLSAPTDGRAKVRVVQASVRTPVLDVAAADGPMIADGVQFATTTDYQQVEPGSWRLKLTGAGGPSTDAEVRLTGGAVYSLLVLDAQAGRAHRRAAPRRRGRHRRPGRRGGHRRRWHRRGRARRVPTGGRRSGRGGRRGGMLLWRRRRRTTW